MGIPAEIMGRIDTKIAELLEVVVSVFGITIDHPTVVYTLRGQAAGTANSETGVIRLNADLLLGNTEPFISTIVPHEVAHLVVPAIMPDKQHPRLPNGKRDLHGLVWRRVMAVFNANAGRTHKFNTKPGPRSYIYECLGCQAMLPVGLRRHVSIQKHPERYFHTSCKSYGLKLISAPATCTHQT